MRAALFVALLGCHGAEPRFQCQTDGAHVCIPDSCPSGRCVAREQAWCAPAGCYDTEADCKANVTGDVPIKSPSQPCGLTGAKEAMKLRDQR